MSIDFALSGQLSAAMVVFMLPIDFALYGQLSASRVAPSIFALGSGFPMQGNCVFLMHWKFIGNT